MPKNVRSLNLFQLISRAISDGLKEGRNRRVYETTYSRQLDADELRRLRDLRASHNRC